MVDSGLHYRNKTRSWALEQFKKFALDESDFVWKEVTRYMSAPGQATSYMIGRLVILNARRKAEKSLGFRFDLKEFHYQVSDESPAIFYLVIYFIKNYICLILKSNKDWKGN